MAGHFRGIKLSSALALSSAMKNILCKVFSSLTHTILMVRRKSPCKCVDKLYIYSLLAGSPHVVLLYDPTHFHSTLRLVSPLSGCCCRNLHTHQVNYPQEDSSSSSSAWQGGRCIKFAAGICISFSISRELFSLICWHNKKAFILSLLLLRRC